MLCLYLLQASAAPDVWLQLLQQCVADPNCQTTALHQAICILAQQMVEQRALSAQQVSDQQERLLAQKQQIEVQQKQIALTCRGSYSGCSCSGSNSSARMADLLLGDVVVSVEGMRNLRWPVAACRSI